MGKKGQSNFKSAVDIAHGTSLLAKNQIKLMSKKQRLKYYSRFDGDTDKQLLQLKLMSKKQRLEFYSRLDEEASKTTKRAALYARVFIKTVLKKDRAKFYKNLNDELKEDFLRDNPDWKNDIITDN